MKLVYVAAELAVKTENVLLRAGSHAITLTKPPPLLKPVAHMRLVSMQKLDVMLGTRLFMKPISSTKPYCEPGTPHLGFDAKPRP